MRSENNSAVTEDRLKSLEKEMEEYGFQQTMKNLSSEASPSMETN